MKSSIKLNQLVASLEAMEEQELNVNPEDSLHEMQEAQIALEGYQDLLLVHNRLTASGVKLDESVVGNLLSLASPKINKDPLLSNYSQESVADKAKDFGKWVMEKIKALIAWIKEKGGKLINVIKNGFSKLFDKTDRMVEKLKNYSKEHGNDIKIPDGFVLDNSTHQYSLIYDNKKLFELKEIKNGIEVLLVSIPEHLYTVVKKENLLVRQDLEAFSKEINRFAKGNKKGKNEEGIELQNIEGTNFFLHAEPNSIHTAWGYGSIKKMFGEDYFPKEIKVDRNYDIEIDTFINIFDTCKINFSKKFKEYSEGINSMSLLLEKELNKDHSHLDEPLKEMQDIFKENLEVSISLTKSYLKIFQQNYNYSVGVIDDLIRLGDEVITIKLAEDGLNPDGSKI